MEGHRWRFRELVTHHAVDVMQPNVLYNGGYTETLKVAHMAQAFNLPMANGGGWPIFNMHLLAGVMNGGPVEFHYGMWMTGKHFFDGTPDPVNGKMRIPDRPGLGFTPNYDALEDSAHPRSGDEPSQEPRRPRLSAARAIIHTDADRKRRLSESSNRRVTRAGPQTPADSGIKIKIKAKTNREETMMRNLTLCEPPGAARSLIIGAVCAAAVLAATPAMADYPDRDITMIIPFGAGRRQRRAGSHHRERHRRTETGSGNDPAREQARRLRRRRLHRRRHGRRAIPTSSRRSASPSSRRRCWADRR